MNLQTGKTLVGWRRAVTAALAGGALAAGVLVAAPPVYAEPDDSTEAPATPKMSPDQILQTIAADYDTGAGGGQVSNLIHQVMKLRALGFRPSNGNNAALQEALDKRPNQSPLVEALRNTVAYQRKLQAQQASAGNTQQPIAIGGGQPLPPGVPPDPGNPNNTGIGLGIPGQTIGQPIG